MLFRRNDRAAVVVDTLKTNHRVGERHHGGRVARDRPASRALISLTVEVSSARDVPGVDTGSARGTAAADAWRASRSVATDTNAIATTPPKGTIHRLLMTLMFSKEGVIGGSSSSVAYRLPACGMPRYGNDVR
jgi:hypothetical protein